jgi:hypothetical protein
MMVARVKRKRKRKAKRKGAGKGQAFERKTCRQLSLWVSDGKIDDMFWRTSISGGRATVRFAQGKATQAVGDICAVRPEGFVFTDRYFAECKHRKSLDLHAFMFGKGKLYAFWVQAVQQAIQHKRIPLLIAKQNKVPTIVVSFICELGEPISSVWFKHTAIASIYYLAEVLEQKFRA